MNAFQEMAVGAAIAILINAVCLGLWWLDHRRGERKMRDLYTKPYLHPVKGSSTNQRKEPIQ